MVGEIFMDKLAVFKENIFAWYDFKENANGIVYSQDEDYLQILGQKINIVPSDAKEKLDYIILINQDAVLLKIQKHLTQITDATKIIMIGENDLSVKNLTTYPKSQEVLEKSESTTIADLEKQMQSLGLGYHNLYYAFPKIDFVDVLFEETYEMSEEQIDKYRPIAEETQIKTLDETKFLKKIIQKDKSLLKVFANSYFLEFSKKEVRKDVKFVSFNNTRKEEYRLMTVIRGKVVEKIALSRKAEKHLENMKKNIAILQKYQIPILDYVEHGKCYSKLVENAHTLDVTLAEHAQDLDFVVGILNQIKTLLEKQAIPYQENMQESLQEYEMDVEQLKNLKFLENAFVDFVPKNCFEIEKKFYFFDQEWNRKFLPVDFIIYRSIINCYELVKKININELFAKLNMTEFVPIFEKINQKIMTDILDKELYETIIKKEPKRIDNVVNEREIALKQIADFEKEDLNKTKVIQDLTEEGARKDKAIADLMQEEAKKEKVIADLMQEETKKDKAIADFMQEETKKDKAIADLMQEEKNKEAYIQALEGAKKNKEQEAQNLSEMNQKKDETIEHLNEIIKVKDHQIEVYENMKLVKMVKKLRGNK